MSSELASLHDIEYAAVRGWPALEQHEVDGWIWRFTSGGSIRANSVAALTHTGVDVGKTIAVIEALYGAKGAPAVFTVSDAAQPGDLDIRLAAHGYERGEDHITMAKRVDATAVMPPAFKVASTPPAGWMDAYLSGLSPDRRAIAPRLIDNLLSRNTVFVAHLTNGVATSSGLTVIDGTVASVQCMATLPDARGRGGAKAVLAAIEAIALQHGAATLYLQTSADNKPAGALYSGIGYAVVGHYHTRTKLLAVSAQT